MENLSVSDDNSDLGHQPETPESSNAIDRSNTDTTLFSSLYGDDSFKHCRTSSQASAFSDRTDDNSYTDDSSSFGWPILKSITHDQSFLTRLVKKEETHVVDEKPSSKEANSSEINMMKERFSKLLLGEDMSGGGRGVCTAVALSNAITNLYATVFGQSLKLEPLASEKKSMWMREMNCLLSVCDYIVEFIPASQMFQDGKTVEIMTNRPRADIYINLPALQKLDTMLLELLDSFKGTEFWYIDQGTLSSSRSDSGSFRKAIHPKEEKWWLPVPCVPPGGLSEKSRKQLQNKRDSANQILKAAMAINSSVLGEMEVPEAYMVALPKTGRAKLGDSIYRYMSCTEKFSPDYLLDCLNITSELEALDLADRVEASMYTWRRKACMNNSKSSWDMVKELVTDTDKNDKNHTLASRAENLLFCLKQRFPEMLQTTLDSCKIQYNSDVGQAVLESYSRVLEGLAFNIVAWIEDVLYVDSSSKSNEEQ